MDAPRATAPSKPNAATVLVADDSGAVRGMIARKLNGEKFLEVVATAGDGREAVELYKKHRPDFAILDIYMPGMTGIEALEEIRKFDREARVFIYSAITKRDAEEVFRAVTNMGAVEFLEKPSGAAEVHAFLESLSRKMCGIGARKGDKTEANASIKIAQNKPLPPLLPYPKMALIPKVLAIGSSTGGPQALMKVLKPLKGKCHVPIIITQHMPASFTGILAKQIQDETDIQTFEAQDGQLLEGGKIYIAPGDYHMRFKKNVDGKPVVSLKQDPPINYCRPAVDPMFESILEIYPNNILAVILTGMGSDGLGGSRKIVESGRNILIAQDKATSVVWGMPQAVAQAGLCQEILPLTEIPQKILTILGQ